MANIYLIPGLGGDKRMYHGQLQKFPHTEVLEFIRPESGEHISSYAKRLAEKINKDEPFILVGVSLGGILSQEIAQIYPPIKTVIISSVKKREELPIFIRMAKYFPIHKFIHGKVYLWAFMILVGLKSKFTRANSITANLRNMAKDADPVFVKWAVNQVVNWKNPDPNFSPFRLHGNDDALFPFKRCKDVDVCINKGTHAMILTHVKEINNALETQLH